MKFINYTNDGRVVVQHAALILSKLDETDTLELHTMDNAIILLKKDMTLVETRDVLQGMHDSFSTALTSSGIRLSCWQQPHCSIT